MIFVKHYTVDIELGSGEELEVTLGIEVSMTDGDIDSFELSEHWIGAYSADVEAAPEVPADLLDRAFAQARERAEDDLDSLWQEYDKAAELDSFEPYL